MYHSVWTIILSTLLMAMPEVFAARGSRKLMGSNGGSKKGKGEEGNLIECPEPAIGQLFSSSNAADGN